MTSPPALASRIDTVRRFNRFYTRTIGALHEHLLDSPYSLTEARVLWELAHHAPLTATALTQQLRLDPGYISRLLRRFKEHGLIRTQPAPQDARQQWLSLTAKGRKAFAPLDRRSHDAAATLLSSLPGEAQARLVAAMTCIEQTLDPQTPAVEPGAASTADERGHRAFTLRSPRPGDMGWVIARHGAIYAAEFGWDARFEAMVARICADFVEQFKPGREACWIAEHEGRNVGSVFVVEASRTVAQLRMLIVEPDARGLGIGAALVAQVEAFAREQGYRRIRLWTNSLLTAARNIYRRHGYVMTGSEAHHSFGHDLVGETWELKL